jgi:hypothetical protein
MADLVSDCVHEEGPVRVDQVLGALADVYSIDRITKRTRPYLLRAVAAAESRGSIVVRGDFLWPAGMQRLPVRSISGTTETRSIHEVAPEELQEAVLAVLRVAFAMAHNDLAVAVARGLGYERTGTQVHAAITTAIGRLLQDGQLARPWPPWNGSRGD